MEKVILVDNDDIEIGVMEKMEAHRTGLLHRAVSVFIVNSKGDWLLQRRAFTKYHSNGLWSNAACSHPAPGESPLSASNRRLFQEMGLNTNLSFAFSFIYFENLDSSLIEHELDHVFIGISDELPTLNPEEVVDFKYISFEKLQNDILLHPENYTVWFKKIYEPVNLFLGSF